MEKCGRNGDGGKCLTIDSKNKQTDPAKFRF